jgi:2-phospho-L-lactate guanylyltransferase
MSTVLAILPVKTFSEAKGRLRTGLHPGERRALAEAMFCDVLIALRRARAIDSVLVVSGDHGAQTIAGGYGAEVIEDEEQGHNPAARRGVQAALERGADRVLLVPGDCPTLDPAEVSELVQRPIPLRAALVVPDRHGTGTNALLLRPPDVLDPSFGPDSCERHLTGAREAGIHAEVAHIESLALDIDTAEDLDALGLALAQRHGGAANTRGMLMQLARSRGR